MNLAQAREQNLDVYMFPKNRNDLRSRLRDSLGSTGRVVTEFEEEIAGFTLLVLAVTRKPREESAEVKARRKTIRDFIHQEEA